MKYNLLPNTDITVSKICLGTMTWGKQNSESEGHQQMDFAFDKGVNFLTQPNFTQFQQKQKLMERQKEL